MPFDISSFYMNNYRLALRYLKHFLWGIFALIGLYLVAAVLLSVIPNQLSSNGPCESEEKTIYLVTNGIHLDIVLKKEDINKSFLEELKVADNTNFVAFGWGDKDFYLNTPTWDDLTMKTLTKALFWKSETAMHVTDYYSQGNSFVPVSVCAAQLNDLQAYIEDSFNKVDSKVVQVGKGYGSRDRFYEAKGSYNALNTCNVWVNKALKRAKVKTAVWSPSDKGVLYHAENQLSNK